MSRYHVANFIQHNFWYTYCIIIKLIWDNVRAIKFFSSNLNMRKHEDENTKLWKCKNTNTKPRDTFKSIIIEFSLLNFCVFIVKVSRFFLHTFVFSRFCLCRFVFFVFVFSYFPDFTVEITIKKNMMALKGHHKFTMTKDIIIWKVHLIVYKLKNSTMSVSLTIKFFNLSSSKYFQVKKQNRKYCNYFSIMKTTEKRKAKLLELTWDCVVLGNIV